MIFQRKNIRLKQKAYEIPGRIFSITICTWNRHPVFKNDEHAEAIVSTLGTGPFGTRTQRFAFCLMPDHLHLLTAPVNGNLTTLINGWKRFTGNLFKGYNMEGPLWQRGFYDHALRNEEDIQKAAEYIVNNPVRAGIVNNWEEYPYAWHRWM